MKRIVISKSAKRRNVPKGSGLYAFTEMVVYKGKGQSITKHEAVPPILQLRY